MGNLSHFDPGWHQTIAEPLDTSIDGLVLRRVDGALGHKLAGLVGANAAHLTRHGDYVDLVAMTRAELVSHYVGAGVFEAALVSDDRVHGTASLMRYRPDVFGIGYWLAADSTGRGFATAAASALIDVACTFGATEVWAGIRATNAASNAVVERLGFALARRQPTHLSYRREL